MFSKEREFGVTPIHLAVKSGSVEVIDFFIHHCPQAFQVPDNDLETPIHALCDVLIKKSWLPAYTDDFPHILLELENRLEHYIA